MQMKVIFVFLDGVGLAERSEHNPVFITPMTRFKHAFGCELFLEDAPYINSDKLMLAIDAGLGVDGAGESGTGQFSIYTGINGAKRFGRHYGPHIPSSLRPILAEENIFRKLKSLGKSCFYANAYPKRFIEWCLDQRTKGKIRSSVLFEAAILENIPIQSSEALKADKAISGDIIARWWRLNETDGEQSVQEISATQAARNLLTLSQQHEVVFYEFFLTDLAAHGKIQTPSSEIIERLDEFLSVLIKELPKRTMLLLTSDHGNFEDTRTTRHTQNPVPFLAMGEGALAFSGIKAIDEICKVMLTVVKS
jgi:2,3-bisphosphoglycerate-independent phosphoglycerate mutase